MLRAARRACLIGSADAPKVRYEELREADSASRAGTARASPSANIASMCSAVSVQGGRVYHRCNLISTTFFPQFRQRSTLPKGWVSGLS